eukprot:755156-Hanusia_phi.AAC.1
MPAVQARCHRTLLQPGSKNLCHRTLRCPAIFPILVELFTPQHSLPSSHTGVSDRRISPSESPANIQSGPNRLRLPPYLSSGQAVAHPHRTFPSSLCACCEASQHTQSSARLTSSQAQPAAAHLQVFQFDRDQGSRIGAAISQVVGEPRD